MRDRSLGVLAAITALAFLLRFSTLDAMSLGYDSSRLYHKIAELMIELDKNFEGARAMVLKAIEMEEGVADFHMTLARVYKGMGQKAAAKVQLEKVLKLEPKNKLAAKELKALKRG